MGKKSKKLNKTLDSQVSLDSSGKSELVDSEINSCLTSTHSVKKTKKKRDFNGTLTVDTPEQIQSEGVIESEPDPTTVKIKKKKNKFLPETNESEADGEDQSKKIDEIETSAPKKKNKKHSVDQAENQQIDQDNVEIRAGEPQKSPTKKKNKDKSINGLDATVPIKDNGEVPKKKKKGRNKAKTGAPVLNDEEAQVTQEEIDTFCDELDDEDNKQYEEWVELLDARLGKKQTKMEKK